MTDTTHREIEDLIPLLRSSARRMTRNHDNADDLVQTCLERALRCLDQYRPGTNLKAWMFTILRNAHINEIRRQARWTDSIDASECEDLFPVRGEQEVHLEFEDFRRAFGLLAERDQDVLSLVGGNGLSYQEAADELDVAVGTIRSRLSRARTRLTEMMECPPSAHSDGAAQSAFG